MTNLGSRRRGTAEKGFDWTMTRETKVGLLFGLGLVLVAGIFLTDYLSVAQRRLAPEMTDFAIEAQETLVPPRYEPIEQPGGLIPQNRVIETPRGTLLVPPTPTMSDGHRPDPKVVRRVIETPRAVGQEQQLAKELAEVVTSPPPTRQEPVPVAVQPNHHTVQAGETLWVIANRYYGDGASWRQIQQANSTRVDGSGNVKVGVRLVIPHGSTHSEQLQPVSPAERGETRWVKVRSRDTLSTIAARELGHAKLWRTIFEANRDRVKNPDRLQIGLTLRVPVRG